MLVTFPRMRQLSQVKIIEGANPILIISICTIGNVNVLSRVNRDCRCRFNLAAVRLFQAENASSRACEDVVSVSPLALLVTEVAIIGWTASVSAGHDQKNLPAFFGRDADRND